MPYEGISFSCSILDRNICAIYWSTNHVILLPQRIKVIVVLVRNERFQSWLTSRRRKKAATKPIWKAIRNLKKNHSNQLVQVEWPRHTTFFSFQKNYLSDPIECQKSKCVLVLAENQKKRERKTALPSDKKKWRTWREWENQNQLIDALDLMSETMDDLTNKKRNNTCTNFRRESLYS